MVSMKELETTTSVCPECLKVISATIYEEDGKVWIKKECEEHGEFKDLYWGSYDFYKKAKEYARDGKGLENPNIDEENPVCPKDCGLCNLHKSHTALANIVLTNRCDLTCFYCFFYAKKAGYVYEPNIDQIEEMVELLRNEQPIPCNAVQLTGGEPTLRNDLPEIIDLIHSHGVDHVQLNTNAIRLANEDGFAEEMKEAGVNTVYMSFDGVTEETNIKNHWEAPKAIENCRNAGLGIVLVPTIINNFNDHEVGDILKYGFKNNDVISGVNFQPVSLVGRMPREKREEQRITIPDVLERIEDHTDGQIKMDDFYPVPTAMIISKFAEAISGKPMYDLSSHFACGVATYVFQDDDGGLVPINRFVDVEGFLDYLEEKTEELEGGGNRLVAGVKVLNKLSDFIDDDREPEGLNLSKILFDVFRTRDYEALGEFHKRSLFIGMMHFQDLYNYDIERVKRCCIHYAMTDGRIV
ncbi:MAG: radical SAM protein, partial [Hadesarchaea archaeon]|nr:radical SAM protein [Hadesarchaea archaeon]